MINIETIPASDNAEPDDNADVRENADLREVDRSLQVAETFDAKCLWWLKYLYVLLFYGKSRKKVKGRREKLSILTEIGRDSIKKARDRQ